MEDHDVDDAVAALADAEQVGRQAMAEIRRTVSVLATEPTGAHPLPCAEDIDALVAQVRDAGLPVDFTSRGDLTRLSPAIGLGMYRILQESLTNVAKHAPGETARVNVDVGRARASLRRPQPAARAHCRPRRVRHLRDGVARRADRRRVPGRPGRLRPAAVGGRPRRTRGRRALRREEGLG